MNYVQAKKNVQLLFNVCIGILVFHSYCFSSTPASTNEDTKNDVFSLSLQELLELKVTSSYRKAEKAFVTPDAIYVITNEDIRRSGHTSIADLLRMVPGVQVAQIDANKFAVSSRGFNGRYANKLLVQIDGRTIYSPLHSGVYWENHDLVFEDIDRIEVIRGPGATLWGANAVNGIINIITKNSRDTKGLYIDGAIGNKLKIGNIRWGDSLNDQFFYRVYGKYVSRDAHLNIEKNDGHDELDMPRGGFRCDWNLSKKHYLTFQGDYYQGDVGQEYGTSSGVDIFDTDTEGFNTLLRSTHTFSKTSSLSIQMYYDRSERKDSKLEERTDIYDIDLQHNFSIIPRNDIIWGLGFRKITENTNKVNLTEFIPDDPELESYSGFLQDKIMIIQDQLFLIPGVKFEDNYYTGYEAQPSGKLLVTPNENHTIWLSISRAVRTPSIFERSVNISIPMRLTTMTLLEGDSDLESEVLYAYELGYRTWPIESLSTSIAFYYNDYDKLIKSDFSGGAPTFNNEQKAKTYGGEISVNWYVTEAIRLIAWYAFLEGEIKDKTTGEKSDIADPEHNAHIRAYFNLPHNLSLTTSLYYVGEYKSEKKIPEYYRLDMVTKWSPSKHLEFSLVGQNLLVFQDGDFVSEHQEFNFSRPDSGFIERSIYGQVSFRW